MRRGIETEVAKHWRSGAVCAEALDLLVQCDQNEDTWEGN